MPGFETEDIEASVRMLEVADTGAILVFNGRNKAVLETLGVCLQHHRPLLVDRNESISAEMEASNNEDDQKPKIKQELQQDDSTFETSDDDNNVEEDFNDKLMMDQDFSDSEDESEELPIEYGERNEDFEDECDLSISDEEEEDQNANKSFELSDDDAASVKQSYQEDKMKEVQALLKKSDKVWSCESCGYSNRNKHLVTLHAETHVKGLLFPCRYCSKVCSKRLTLKNHIYNVHKKLKESEWNAKQEERGSLENKQQKNKGDLDQEIDEKIVMLMEKVDGKTWKCKLCDKTGQKSSISQHCEARHLMGYSHPCHLCDHKTATRNALKGHIRVKHSGK